MFKNIIVGILLTYLIVLIYFDITPSESLYLLETLPGYIKYKINFI